MQYIEAARDPESGGCPFCTLVETGDPDGDRVLARDDLAFVTLAKYPYNPGHLLILPIRHTGDLEDLSEAEEAAIGRMLRRSLRALREASEPGGFNIGLNLGRSGGAGIPEHLHWHVVPRWGGDTNFMPVVGETRVLPELLQETYLKLRPRFDET
jgi:ATP adenylyltransferase